MNEIQGLDYAGCDNDQQGLACRKQHRVVSDAVELKVKGRIEILDIKKKLLLFIASCSSYYHGTFIFFLLFFY